MKCHSSYLHSALDRNKIDLTVNTLIHLIQENKFDFDAIAFTGMSGALIAPLVAQRLQKGLLMVRKTGDGSHSGYIVEGGLDCTKFIIIDDLIMSGNTIRNLLEKVKTVCPNATCSGIILYHEEANDYDFENRIPVRSFRLLDSRITYRGKRETLPLSFSRSKTKHAAADEVPNGLSYAMT